MYSGGGDCVARVWDVSADKDTKDAEKGALNEADEAVTAITATPTAWITASADSGVRLYNSESNQLQAVILEGGGVPIRDVAADPSFERLAVASE
jgi:WD40 repeat protein